MFHTLYIIQRDTRICTYLGFFAILYPLTLSQLWDSSVKTPVIYFFIPPSSASADVSAISLVPTRSIPCLFPPTHTRPPPRFLSTTSHRARIGGVAIYCAAVFCLSQMLFSNASNSASSLAPSVKMFYHLPSDHLSGICPIRGRSTWSWKNPRTLPMRGLTTQVFSPKSNTDWTTALKKPWTPNALPPSLLRFFEILCHTYRAFFRFWITAVQS